VADAVTTQVGEWMRSQGTTLWGRAFDLSQNVDVAAEWFASEMQDFCDYVERQQHEVPEPDDYYEPKHLGLPRSSYDVV
jgi:hypothetical protein